MATEAAKSLFCLNSKHGSIQRVHHKGEVIMGQLGLTRRLHGGLRYFGHGTGSGRGTNGIDHAKLVDRQVDRTVVGERVNRKVLGGKKYCKAGVISSGNGGKGGSDGRTGEHSKAIDRNNEGPDALTTDVADVRRRQT